MIFFGIIGTWTVLVQYDRREKRIATAKWRRLVADLKEGTLPVTALQRKLTVVLGAPPADGVIVAREHFLEYVKPVLEDSGLDWDAVEGRREGEIRAGMAERIRKIRLKKGEPGTQQLEDWEILLDDIRARSGVKPVEGVTGDLVIGRHAWKEYVRGLHEGWLGPMDPPAVSQPDVQTFITPETSGADLAGKPPSAQPAASDDPLMLGQSETGDKETSMPSQATDDGKSPPEEKKAEEEKTEEEAAETTKKKKRQPPPFIGTTDYSSATLSANCPDILGPSEPIPMPHLLGFFNFPTRIYRYLRKRDLAETIGQQTAAAVLAVYQPYMADGQRASGFIDASPSVQLDGETSGDNEIKEALQHEESEWHKTIRNREGPPDEGKEFTWTDQMVLDPRITSRMRRFVLTDEELDRARSLDKQIRQEKWSQLMDIPSRIWRGAANTLFGAPREQHHLDTVGDASDLE